MSVEGGVLGVVLAGGLARRMGGGDKCLIELGGVTILERVLERLRPQCAMTVINANGDPARFAAYGADVVADSVDGNPGPLAGVLAGLERAKREGLAWAATAAGDSPFLPRDLVGRLAETVRHEDTAMAVAASQSDGQVRRHPVFGLWPVSCADELRRRLVEEGTRKIVEFTDSIGCADALYGEEKVDPFVNVNSPEDVAACGALLEEADR